MNYVMFCLGIKKKNKSNHPKISSKENARTNILISKLACVPFERINKKDLWNLFSRLIADLFMLHVKRNSFTSTEFHINKFRCSGVSKYTNSTLFLLRSNLIIHIIHATHSIQRSIYLIWNLVTRKRRWLMEFNFSKNSIILKSWADLCYHPHIPCWKKNRGLISFNDNLSKSALK